MKENGEIRITGAREHNLKNITLSLPKNRFIVVTGVSGSGKSSLVFDVLYREAENRYLGSVSSFARQFMGKMHKPEVDGIEGLSPAIALNQRMVVSNPRSTLGTISGIHDLLRLLFARMGESEGPLNGKPLSRNLFSFNTATGACPVCKGLGVEDFLDSSLLIADENRSLRQGALVITAPNGYIIYSQVTLDVLDQVCRAEGFNIDIPWKELTWDQKNIIYYGSNKIEVPFGKHPLESRMKWTGITAKPREMGYYRGILTIMQEILKRDRNKNILRFVRSVPCHACNGRRLNPEALSVKVGGMNIAGLSEMTLDQLSGWLKSVAPFLGRQELFDRISEKINALTSLMARMGLGHLTSSRESSSLSGGEAQRLRLATLAGTGLSNVIFVLDEPSVGLHPAEMQPVIEILKEIRDGGNTVIVVEHEEEFMRQADWLADIGPGPGSQGGEVVWNGTPEDVKKADPALIHSSPTLRLLTEADTEYRHRTVRPEKGRIRLTGIKARNLKDITVEFRLHAVNVVTGVSGAGKTTLTEEVLARFLTDQLEGKRGINYPFQTIEGFEPVRKLAVIDQSPIGRTPRSNPATYTGLFDLVRELYARQPLSLERGYDRSRFSFNTAGGRCEGCQGAGYRQVGMHFLGDVEVVCEVCEGKRFDDATLEVLYHGRNISEVLDMTVEEAMAFFSGEKGLLHTLEMMEIMGLGYLKLGQRSSTLSGGEAQRIRLAAEISKPEAVHTLYLMDEPTTGLHQADVEKLIKAIDRLIIRGNTVVATEQHRGFILAADHLISLGPGSGEHGGELLFMGIPARESMTQLSIGQRFMNSDLLQLPVKERQFIRLSGVTTNNLKNIDVDIPVNRLTAVTGISGSGKSSLAFDTLHAEAQRRFLDGFSPYIRSRIGMPDQAGVESAEGLTPTLALRQTFSANNPRSTLGTMTGIYDLYRLLFARLALKHGMSQGMVSSTLFSFNHLQGACKACNGMGVLTRCDTEKLIAHPDRAVVDGAMDGSRTGRFYGDPDGQYMATLKAAARARQLDISLPWNHLSAEARNLIMEGAGMEEFHVVWDYQRGKRRGEHHFKGRWAGLSALVEEEYRRKHADHRGEGMMSVMKSVVCPECRGKRLNDEALSRELSGMNIASLSDLAVEEAIVFFDRLPSQFAQDETLANVAISLVSRILQKLQVLAGLGLAYLPVSRPADHLSTGEFRRLQLAALMGSGLTGITFVLDEPTAGLHPQDTEILLQHMKRWRDEGNTVVMVEHDPAVILAADHVIDIGPGSGENGGRVVAEGNPQLIINHPESVTGRYLHTGEGSNREHNRVLKEGLTIIGAEAHNLKGFDLIIPAGGITVVSGVSGAGKSSLLTEVILASMMAGKPSGCRSFSGTDRFTRVVAAEGNAGFTSPAAVVATFTGLLDLIRVMMSEEPEAMKRGFTKSHFSFLDKEGQCPFCEGMGVITTSLDFLPDLTTLCDQCQGKRYRPEILEVRYCGYSMAGILDLNIECAANLFHDIKKPTTILSILMETGLGYLRLGQPLNTLSGGESQRLRLATELLKPVRGKALYLFDEPTTGLHPHDVEKLLLLFGKLADEGHTLILAENDPEVVRYADKWIELGPEGGARGGYLIDFH